MKFLLADVMITVTANRLPYFFFVCKYYAAVKYVHFGHFIYGVIQDALYELTQDMLRIYDNCFP
jgi:hypothetical protein